MEGIADADYAQAKQVCKYFQANISLNVLICMFKANLLLADVFNNIWNMWLDLAHLLFASRLA